MQRVTASGDRPAKMIPRRSAHVQSKKKNFAGSPNAKQHAPRLAALVESCEAVQVVRIGVRPGLLLQAP
jgi:hypothetical protein